MTKEAIYELQKIDCNCNDCWYMVRDIDKFNEWKEYYHQQAFESAELARQKKLRLSEEWAAKGEYTIASELVRGAEKIKVEHFVPQQLIQYGNCSKLKKPVSFIPNTCQLDTQNCFEHRKD